MGRIPGSRDVERIGIDPTRISGAPPVYMPDIGKISMGGDILAKAFQEASSAIGRKMDKDKADRQNMDFTRGRLKAQEELGRIGMDFDKDQDFATGPQRFDEAVAKSRDQFLQTYTDPKVREALGATYDELALREKQQFLHKSRTNEENFHVVRWETERNSAVQSYALAQNDQSRQEQLALADSTIDAVGRWAGPAWVEKEKARFLQDGQTLQATHMIRQDPTAARGVLADEAQFPALPPMKRVQLESQAQAQQEANLRQQEHLAAVREREHRQVQEDNALGAFAGLVNGRYSLADLKRDVAARKFSLSDARSLHRLLIEEQPGTSNPNTRLALVDSLTQGQDVRGAVLTAVQAGELTAGDAMQLLERNRAVQRQEGPFSSAEFREAKDLLGRTFGQGGNQFDYTRQDRFAQALDELQQVTQEKGSAAALPAARKILARELERGVARPAGYAGEMSTRGMEEYRARLAREFASLPAAEQAKQAARYNGTLGQIEQAMTALTRIEDIKRSLPNGGKQQ